ncbi:MAG: hypothetical protein H6626_15020 [Pseudobdellovibrionaceae bacterium]|nr:hypothetical protein [Bdellovibrionales bacterium]USN47464.1 MAG: hypothetical protein H6626_15020 [Pseudobdellovibrionaceae bacterium]
MLRMIGWSWALALLILNTNSALGSSLNLSLPDGFELDLRHPKNHSTRMSQPSNTGESQTVEIRFLSMTATDVLEIDGVQIPEYDYPCSTHHKRDDWSNRWCHTGVVEAVKAQLEIQGVHSALANAMASSIFLIKESLIDDHFSKADVVVGGITLFDDKKDQVNVKVTPFLDGAFVVEFRWEK